MKINPIGHLVKTNPIQTQSNLVLSAVEWANLKRAKMNVNLTLTNDYRKKDDFAVRKNKPNSNPICQRVKMNANVFITKDYENDTALRPKKTNPNKANFKRSLFAAKIGNFACRLHSLNRTCACVSLDLVFARKPGGAGRCERKPKLRSSAEKTGEYRLFGHLLQPVKR